MIIPVFLPCTIIDTVRVNRKISVKFHVLVIESGNDNTFFSFFMYKNTRQQKNLSKPVPTTIMMYLLLLSQDDVTGDGTTSTVLLIGEFLKQADVYISEGLHPR